MLLKHVFCARCFPSSSAAAVAVAVEEKGMMEMRKNEKRKGEQKKEKKRRGRTMFDSLDTSYSPCVFDVFVVALSFGC